MTREPSKGAGSRRTRSGGGRGGGERLRPRWQQRPPSSRKPEQAPATPRAAPAGLAARRAAVHLVETVLRDRRPLARHVADATGGPFDLRQTPEPPAGGDAKAPTLEPRDRAFAHAMAMAVLRRHGSLMSVLSRFLSRPLPAEAERARMILLVAAAQILLLGTPAHAAVDVAVEQCRRDRAARHFDKLANAVLRRVAAEGPVILSGLDPSRLDVPAWLRERWVRTFGEDEARRIALASLGEPPLDLSASGDGEDWASRLAGTLLSTGSIRLSEHGRVEDLPGYGDGAWWVQDAAAALPARLVGAVVGLRIADLCAAPGGKTAQLATAGARVTAVDVSADRLETVRRNLARLKLADAVALVAADVTAWQPAEAPFDAVLLDAPCTATGTIRRHPDILHLKSEDEIARLAALQGRMLAAAARLVRPGGTLVYCVCSLEPEEGPERIAALLASPGGGGFERLPVRPDEIGAAPGWITPDGDLRTLPHHAPGPDVPGGMDGFYAARLVRRP